MILIYTDELNPRIEYICQLLFTQILQSEISFTTNSDDLLNPDMPVLNYSRKKFGNEFYIKPHRLMYSGNISKPVIRPVAYNGEKYFFESSEESDLPFDPLAASFFLVTRYEEYLEEKRDKYNRFPAKASILYEYGLLKKPVVNIWAGLLAEKLKERYPWFVFSSDKFDFLSTIDIDNAWAYAHKKLWRITGAIVRAAVRGHFKEIKNRILVLWNKIEDPFYSYPFLDKVFKGNESKVIFFFLVGDYKRNDKNVSYKNKYYRKLIYDTAYKYSAGVHFSFSSGKLNKKDKFRAEVRRMEDITGSKINKSRQHFLLLEIPDTYRMLSEAGINEDYTMGFASQTGFRAGICTPYYFYDLKNEAPTNLKIVPFMVMDTTLQNYLGFSASEAREEIEKLMQEVKKVGGLFVSIWHNETLDEKGIRKGYREVFEKMNETGFRWADD
jgi:hypothetical protein